MAEKVIGFKWHEVCKKKDNGYYELPNWLATDALDLLMMELSWRGDGEREPPLGFRPRY